MEKYISSLIEKTPMREQPYFQRLLNKTMNKNQFIETQIYILRAVEEFSRPMFLISSKLETYEERMVLLKNILDEHGNCVIEKTHGNTYKQYLIQLGAREKDFMLKKQHPSVVTFNKTLMSCAENESTMTSLAMMGIIESRYSTISTIIVQSILNNGWIDKEKLTHYSTHENLDIEHAQGFYNLISKGWQNSSSKNEIKKGLLLGNSTIINLYNKLL